MPTINNQCEMFCIVYHLNFNIYDNRLKFDLSNQQISAVCNKSIQVCLIIGYAAYRPYY